ncbi:MAG: CopG family transcriptional regulator [Chloroflexota bacterium]
MAETEKMTINLSVVDLGKIDLVVEEGFYSNRTDFVRTAVRNQLQTHDNQVQQSVVRRTLVMGVVLVSKSDLERDVEKGVKAAYRVVGLLKFADDIPPELIVKTVESVRVYGVLRANKAIRAVLAEKMA